MTDPGPSGSLLIVWHSRTGAAEQAARAAAAGADEAGYPARLLRAEEATVAHMAAAGGYLFVCPENLGTMTGAMKEFFDRCYYPLLGAIEGRPYASVVTAGSAGQGAQAQIERIVTGWRLRQVQPGLILDCQAQTSAQILAPKQLESGAIRQCRELGQGFAAGLDIGIF
ncbi:flavodoxin family protein [Novosphingobium huizhouense]|uniref:flavodoxin family protein n=1 Tax=Novosphingobium huizhouense TaxID=2866625 RepID=UPI001CD83BE3|nr:NAD(P)H-dependent oxidoreductase [Novosphingobium huizhouense]